MGHYPVTSPPKNQVPIPQRKTSLRLMGMDHLVILAPDLVEAERWYIEVMGGDLIGRYNWGGDVDHDVPPHVDIRLGSTVVSIFSGDPGPKPDRMIHYAYACKDLAEWDAWFEHVRGCGVQTIGPTGHDGFTLISLHFDDPWGHGLEIMTNLATPEEAEQVILDRGGAITGRMN